METYGQEMGYSVTQVAMRAGHDPSVAAKHYSGRVAETDVGRSSIDMKVKSLMDLLAVQQMPRRLYQSACTHVFGDAMCTFNRTSMAATIAALAGSTQATSCRPFARWPSNCS